MKQVYQCELCRQLHDSAEDANECELIHKSAGEPELVRFAYREIGRLDLARENVKLSGTSREWDYEKVVVPTNILMKIGRKYYSFRMERPGDE